MDYQHRFLTSELEARGRRNEHVQDLKRDIQAFEEDVRENSGTLHAKLDRRQDLWQFGVAQHRHTLAGTNELQRVDSLLRRQDGRIARLERELRSQRAETELLSRVVEEEAAGDDGRVYEPMEICSDDEGPYGPMGLCSP